MNINNRILHSLSAATCRISLLPVGLYKAIDTTPTANKLLVGNVLHKEIASLNQTLDNQLLYKQYQTSKNQLGSLILYQAIKIMPTRIR